MLELKGVTKSYGQSHAVGPLSLSIAAGRCTVLIGPSGCGKSTLLRMMIGLLRPTSGAVVFEGERLSPARLQQARRRMGYVVQDGGLFPHLTAERNVTVMARRLAWSRDRIRDRLESLCTLTRFPTAALSRYPAQLSGGQQQRVSLMRALMLDPNVLLLDEPLAALDPLVRYDLQTDLHAIFQTLGKTVVLVTHDLAEAAFFGNRLVLLRDGRIVQEGTARELLAAPADPFVTRFINAQRRPIEGMGDG